MRRVLLNLLTAVSLLLCLAVAALWVRGRTGTDGYEKYGPRFGWGVYTGEGELVVMWYFGSDQAEMMPQAYLHRRLPRGFVSHAGGPPADDSFDFYHAGFWFAHKRDGLSHWTAGLPYWFLCLAFAVTPFWRAEMARRRGLRARRQRLGRCPSCGYDLRATPKRCPECGTAPVG